MLHFLTGNKRYSKIYDHHPQLSYLLLNLQNMTKVSVLLLPIQQESESNFTNNNNNNDGGGSGGGSGGGDDNDDI